MTMADRDGVIWFDGEMVPWRDAKVHCLTHTLHYGLGVFEGLRAYKTDKGTAIFRLKEHTDRLFDSAHILNMKMPYSKDDINAACLAAVAPLVPLLTALASSALSDPNVAAIVDSRVRRCS